MMKKVPMTVEGANALREELNRLKTVDRRNIAQAIAEARAHGDLKENAEYHSAKEQQGFIEGRISEIESKLSHAHIIDIRTMPTDGRVVFGCTFTVENVDTGDSQTFKIVGDDEADLKSRKLSVNAPMARAAIGKSEGDAFELQAPGGIQEYEIVTVAYE